MFAVMGLGKDKKAQQQHRGVVVLAKLGQSAKTDNQISHMKISIDTT